MIKSKKILIALAVIGANMFAHNAFAADGDTWYGDGNNATVWAGINIGADSYAHWNEISGACATGANLTLTGSESAVGGIEFGDAKYFFAGHSREGNVTNNILTVSGGTFAGGVQIHGGCSFNGNVSNNKVNIGGSPTFQGFEIYGGRSAWGNAVGNELTFACNSGDLVGSIYGGYGLNAFDNTLTISGGTFISGTTIRNSGFYAGYAHSEGGSGGDARGNKLNITGGDFSFEVGSGDRGFFGGLGADVNSNVIGNIVNITGGTFTFGYSVDEYFDGIFGGKNIYTFSVTGIVSQNVVNIYNGANIKRAKICGGYSKTGDADNNTVNIYGGSFGSTAAVTVYGGYHEKVMLSDPRTISCNAVNIYGGTFSNSSEIYGGYNLNGVAGGDSADKGNKVVIENVTFNSGTGNKIYGGYADGSASKADYNSVTINNGTFESTGDFGVEIVGGENKGNGQASNNKVVINNGTFKGTGNFSVEIVGGKNNGDGQALNNKVIINGGTFEGSGTGKIVIKGGETTGTSNAYYNEVIINNGSFKNFEIYGGHNGYLNNNNVTIKGGTFQGSDNKIYGSNAPTSMANANQQIILEGGIFTGTTSIIAVDGNGMPSGGASTVTIQGTNPLDLSGATLMGYESNSDTDRVLNVNRTNVKVGGIKNFGTLNFTLPEGTTSDDIVLKMQGALDLSAWNVGNITVSGITLADGDYITLMKNVSGSYTGTGSNIKVLEIGAGTGIYELVYYGSVTAPTTAKGDYTIKQDNGTKVWSTTTINGTYSNDIQGNVAESGLSATSYSGNEVIIRRGTYNGSIYGANANGGDVSHNIVSIYGGDFSASSECKVYGADTSNGSANYNTVNIYDGIFSAGEHTYIYGGSATAGTANYNVVNIYGGTFKATSPAHMITLFVGSANSGTGADAIGNKLNIEGGTFVGVSGASPFFCVGDASAKAKENHFVATGGTFGYGTQIIGGRAWFEVSGNTIEISNVEFATDSKIYAGYGNNMDYDVINNHVTINSGTFGNNGEIYGGYNESGNANENKVTINAGTFDNDNIANRTENGNSNGNMVIVNGGNFENYSSERGIWGGYSVSNGNTNENKVYVNGGTFSGYIYFRGGYNADDGEAKENYVEINNGSFGDGAQIYGGYTSAGMPTGNVVKINNGNFGNVKIYAGYGAGTTGEIKNNLVEIKDGSFGDGTEIYAGYGSGNVNNNILTIKDGTFGSIKLYGGKSTAGSAENNTVNILGGSFGNGFSLYGGNSGATSTNNILNLKIKMSGKAAEVWNFQTMNFTLPCNIVAGETMLHTTTMTFDPTNKTAINVYAANGVKLNKDEEIILIKSDNGFIPGDYTTGTILGGAAELVNENDEGFILKIVLLRDFEQKKSAGSEDQQKAPVEGIAAAVQIVNQSADLASGEGMASLIAETAGGETNTFGALTAGQSKYKTGSHVDVDGWGILVGAGKTKEWGNGEATTYGLFFEYGKGDFDTYNGDVHGDGNSKNQGIGIMMRHKMMNNTYYEGNIRFGKQETEWSQSEIGSYDTDSRYYGIMVGMGHIFPAGKNEIDVYGRYTYGHVGACDAKVGDNHYHFDSVKSHRVRVGGKYNFKVKNSNAKPYVGLAWEHEFKGEARASISGVGEAPAPSMKGNTGIMEVGCDWKVSKKWTLGLGVNAYMGKRKGWDGMARVFYNF